MKQLFSAIFLLNFIFANGQNNLLNESKYWVWFDRLVNDWFVSNYTGTYAHNESYFNTMGQLIAKNNINPNENISVGHLKRGLYIFKIFNQNELVQIQKIVLQ